MRKGRPPAQWLELADVKEKEITLREIAALAGITPAGARFALMRIGVEGELRKHGQQYIKVYRVAEVRRAYRATLKAYRGET